MASDPAPDAFLALIGDLGGSRAIRDRDAAQRRLEALLEELNERYSYALAARLAVTSGDEVQGLFQHPEAALDVMIAVTDGMAPHRVNFGLGWGEISTAPRERAPEIDGPCYHRAREALHAAKAQDRWAAARGLGDVMDAAVSSLFSLLGVLRDGWTEKQAAYVAAARRGAAQTSIAQTFEVSPSVVSESLKAAYFKVVMDGEAAIRKLLPAASDPIEIGKSLERLGNLPGALEAYRKARELAARLVAHDPKNWALIRRLAVAHWYAGNAYAMQGHLELALRELRHGFGHFETLARDRPASTVEQRNLSVGHNKIGDVLSQQGRVEEAVREYEAGLVIARKLAAQDPSNAEWQRDLSIGHEGVGDVLLQQGHVEEAVREYEASLAIRKRLAAQDPSNAAGQRGLSISHNKIGNVLLRQGRVEEALREYEASLAIRKRLAAQDPSNVEWQRDLSVSHNKIGDVLLRQGRVEEAVREYEAGLVIARKLAAQDPSNAEWQRDLSISHGKVGDVLLRQGRLDEAVREHEASLAIRKRLAAQDPSNAEWQRDLSFSHNRVASAHERMGRRDDARAHLVAAMAVLERLDKEGKLALSDRPWLDSLRATVAPPRKGKPSKPTRRKKPPRRR